MGSGRAAALSIPEEERRVDPHLGYPRAYGKLCRNAYAWMQLQGYVLPFSEGPPKKFLPYAAHPDDIAKLEELHDLFPIVISDCKKDSTHLHKYKDVIWQQLDHLGNAGFDPASFRVDAYGNVLYWHADPASPLAWEVCHWFPYSRGGKTVLNNLRIVQWQVSLRRTDKLEFLIPWWDLQLGVSVNQFLSAFESTNVGFRQRCFSYLFLGGEDEMPDGKMCVNNHQWSHHFSEKRRKCGLAAAGLVRQKDGENVLKSSSVENSRPPPLPGQQKGWSVEEEEALLRGYQKFGFGRWKEIKESEPALATRSLVQIRDKYRWLTGLGKENLQSPNEKTGSSPYKSPTSTRDSENYALSEYLGNSQNDRLLSSLKRECKIQLLRGEEKQMRQGEASKLQETLNTVKLQNEKEKQALDTLEAELRRQKKLVEKQRQWNETQASYRICLERMIQETMHQSVVYKEEARLNQVACNSLMAQLESQAATCSAAESQLLKHSKERQTLLQMTRPPPLLEFATDKEGLPAIDCNQAEQSSKQLARTSSNKQKNNIVRMPTRSREERNVLQVRDLQNQPTASGPSHAVKQDSLSDSEEHHTHKRLKKSTTTPLKRYHSAPRQRPDKENSKLVAEKEPSSAKRVLKREIPGLDKLYYEGNGISRVRIGESRRTAGHGVNSKMSNSQSENEKVEQNNVVNVSSSSTIKADEGADVDEESAGERVTRTFKLMPVIKRDSQNVDAGYASCGSQRFKGKDLILHAPQSRDSSERFELDVKAIDSRAPPAENNNAMVGCSTRVVAAKKNEDEQLDDILLAAEKAQECGGEINEDESIKQGKTTLDKWLQMLLLSTEPTMEAEAQQSAIEKQVVEPKAATGEIEEIQKQQQSSTDQKSSKIGRGWPEDIGVPPPGLIRAHSIRAAPEERPQLQSKKPSSDKIKVPFSGLFRKLSLRQQSGSGKAGADEEEEVPKRRQVTFEDWEGITSKLAAMHLNNASSKAEGCQRGPRGSTDTRKLRSTSLRASTGSLPKLSNKSSFAAASATGAAELEPKITKSVLYYSTETFRNNKSSSSQGEKQMASIKAMSRRASINECAEAWKKEVNKLESQQPMK